MLFEPPVRPGIAKRTIARIASSPVVTGRPRLFSNIVVHPTQEMRDPDGAFFRGGPDWPCFRAQIFARHCWGAIPRPIDRQPLPYRLDWPYFDPQFLPLFWPHLGIDPRLSPSELDAELSRLAAAHAPMPHQTLAVQDAGFWCGPVSLHFGHMVADFSMRIAASSRIDPVAPLVFTLPPLREPDPPPFFWQIIDHLGVERRRVMLLRQPTRFRRLYVLPQAERPFGGGPSGRHLDVLDALTGAAETPARDIDCVFVSRARLPEGRFAGESYLDEVLQAAGATVFHPEAKELSEQLRIYRRARLLIFSEGSALHGLQLLGRLDARLVVLVRRPGNRIAAASLRPRVRSFDYLLATRSLLYGLTPSGRNDTRAGLSILDEARYIAGLEALGLNLMPFWDPDAYARCRDADLAHWAQARKAAGTHSGEPAVIEDQFRALSLRG